MGAQTEDRLSRIRGRYEALAEVDDVLPPFMYGSHYSTMVGVVLYYLLRLQPYADLHKVVQGGHFDSANRLFSSVQKTWKHNSETTFEVKELTPEWFTLPDFLRNSNSFDLGRMDESNIDLGDVELPNWAANPEDFIRINREALESDYVSAHLHEWIDLIFGYKQRGPAAVEANNLFYYLTYPGAIDRDKLDAATLEGVDAQIAHFGQCPSLIFESPHPSRNLTRRMCVPRPLRCCFSIRTCDMGLVLPINQEEALCYNAYNTLIIDEAATENRNVLPAVVAIKMFSQRVICVRDNGAVNVYRHMICTDARNSLRPNSRLSRTTDQQDNICEGGELSLEEASVTESEAQIASSRTETRLLISVQQETRGRFARGVNSILGRTGHVDGAVLHRLPVQRMRDRHEGVRIPDDESCSSYTLQQRAEGANTMDDLAVRDGCRNYFLGREVRFKCLNCSIAVIFFYNIFRMILSY